MTQGVQGYYRHPALHGDKLVFVAEGDLWTVPLEGGIARRLTSHPGEESRPSFSPDGQLIAFSATYEGPKEIYTIPYYGGLPIRWTYEPLASIVNGWTPQGELLYATSSYSNLPDRQLIKINTQTKVRTIIPLSQASEGSYDETGKHLYFVRPSFHNNVTKRYKGGTARKIWKFTEGAEEAIKLTGDYEGESHTPMCWAARVYFISDRDGIMNIWSMNEQGSDLRQHTFHQDFNVRDASLSQGKIVYQYGADLWKYHIETEENVLIPITIASDLDQLREKWVTNPKSYITNFDFHPKGESIVLTARGRIFVIPSKAGRLIQISRKEGVRYREAIFSSDGDSIIALSDETGEFEFVQIPASGIGEHKPLTDNGKILRYEASPSPDGKWLAYSDHNRDLWLLEVESGKQEIISTNRQGVGDVSWAPDSRWLAFEQTSLNTFIQIFIYQVEEKTLTPITTDRMNSYSPVWSIDGKWMYFLSDRNFESLVGSPWGHRQPEPYFDQEIKIYHISLQKGLRSPFKPMDELFKEEKNGKKNEKKDDEKEKEKKEEVVIHIDLEGIATRLWEVPVDAGNYSHLSINKDALYWINKDIGSNNRSKDLQALKISHESPEVINIISGISGYTLSKDGQKIFIRKGSTYFVTKAGTSKINSLSGDRVNMSNWKFSLNIREDWRQIFRDAWRMERDYFYDPNMHGVDWNAMYDKYLPLIDRITSRNELSDLIGRFVGELSALHTSVGGGDTRKGRVKIDIATLGARFSRDDQAGGFHIEYIYKADPDYPDELSPLDQPDLEIEVGHVITHINGIETLSAVDINALLRNQEDEQVRITYKDEDGIKEAIVTPIGNDDDLRYSDWEYSRRLKVEEDSENEIGYVHLRAMGSEDIAQWYREFYPVFNRRGLIIDVRNNHGGNIDSLILEKLMRRAWMYWKGRVGEPYWNMHYAFRGHMVVLVDSKTSSDGEAFADGFRRLGLGKVIGTRTWGGEIWLSNINWLTDGGIARAPMTGVYGPEGEWLVEGHGVDPDIVVDNLPHETFKGKDAQLDAAIQYLKDEIAKDPRDVPAPPAYPDKSFRGVKA